MKLKFIFFLEHSFASLFMISPEASGLNHDDFIVFLFWRKIKKIVGMISVNIQISQKNPNLFLNWDFGNYLNLGFKPSFFQGLFCCISCS